MAAGILATAAVVGVFFGTYALLYVWTRRWLSSELDKQILADWDVQLRLASPYERDALREHPPVEVLEAMFAMPAVRQGRFPLSLSR